MDRLTPAFFQQNPVTCARELIGARFFWRGCVGRIVETEAYRSIDDPACHMWFRPSTRAYVASHEAGDTYVYLNYGVHWMFNVLVKGADVSGFVLLRALEVVSGFEEIRCRRPGVTDRSLAAGPGKLTRGLGIDGTAHGISFLGSKDCGILAGEAPREIIAGPRIGISKAVDLPWRFGDAASLSLSRKF